MKISESIHTSYLNSLASPRNKSAEPRDIPPVDHQSLSLPSMLALTEASHPARESFLSALSESLRNGLYTCEPEQVADAILARGLETEIHGE